MYNSKIEEEKRKAQKAADEKRDFWSPSHQANDAYASRKNDNAYWDAVFGKNNRSTGNPWDSVSDYRRTETNSRDPNDYIRSFGASIKFNISKTEALHRFLYAITLIYFLVIVASKAIRLKDVTMCCIAYFLFIGAILLTVTTIKKVKSNKSKFPKITRLLIYAGISMLLLITSFIPIAMMFLVILN